MHFIINSIIDLDYFTLYYFINFIINFACTFKIMDRF